MPIRPILGIMFTGHNNSGVGLLTLLGVATIVTKVIEVIMGIECLFGLGSSLDMYICIHVRDKGIYSRGI